MSIIYNISIWLLIFNFIFSIIGIWLFFNNQNKTTLGFSILKILAPICMILTVTTLFYSNQKYNNINVYLGLVLLLISIILFSLCSYINYQKKLTVCYSNDLPEHLMKKGPYKFVRHPFYISYILNYISGFILSLNPISLISVFIMTLLYYHAAKTEENKFKISSLSNEYEIYKKETGMFFPKIL